MSRGYQRLDVDGAAVLAAMKEATSVEEFQRYQAIHLRVNEAMEVAQIARVTGLSESTIHQVHSRCRQKGAAAMKSKAKGGRHHSYLSEAEEKAFLGEFEPEAKQGGILEVAKIHQALAAKVGSKVALYTTYRLLHRHGWRKITPRSKPAKGDPVAQNAFKKTGPHF